MCLVFKLADIFFKAELKQFYYNTVPTLPDGTLYV